jgi:hypothetical protein
MWIVEEQDVFESHPPAGTGPGERCRGQSDHVKHGQAATARAIADLELGPPR